MKPLNEHEPVAVGDLFAPPEWFNAEQQKLWHQVVSDAPLGVLRRTDMAIVETYVVAWHIYRDAALKMRRHGMVCKSPVKGEPMQSPFMAIMNKQAVIMMKAAAEMGFTPSSRSRIQVIHDDKKKNADPLAEFIGGEESRLSYH